MLQLPTIFFLITAFVWAGIHYLATQLFLYWQFIWFDIPMHFLGGVVVALGVFTLRDLRIIPNGWLHLVSVLAFVLCMALVWEVFEFMIGTPVEDSFYIDTAIDLLMGLSGGYLGYAVGKLLRNL